MRDIVKDNAGRRTIRLRRERHNSLCEAVNRILDTGVVALGEVKLSVAEVDLVYVGLQLVVTSIGKSNEFACNGARRVPDSTPSEPPRRETSEPRQAPASVAHSASADIVPSSPSLSIMPETSDGRREKNGLGQLVLTVVKLLHELMKKQAVSRMEAGNLTDAQIDRLGETLKRQATELERLREEFGLKDEDLNLDLGPLGKLF